MLKEKRLHRLLCGTERKEGDGMHRWERKLLNLIQDKGRSRKGDRAMKAVSRLGDKGAVWLLLTGALALRPKTRKTSTALTIALALDAATCNLVIKPLANRVRPFERDPTVRLMVPPPPDPSFPSGHTTAAFAVTTGLYQNGSRLWVPSMAMALLTATSRMYLYLHYPSDVVAGGLLGVLVGQLGTKLNDACWDRRDKKRAQREEDAAPSQPSPVATKSIPRPKGSRRAT